MMISMPFDSWVAMQFCRRHRREQEVRWTQCWYFFLFVCLYFLYLVFMAGALAVLCEALQSLVDEGHVLLIDVEPQQAQTPCGAATDTVQELQSLTHQVVVVLVVLPTEEVLRRAERTGEVRASIKARVINNISD